MDCMASNESTTGFGRYRKREKKLDKRSRGEGKVPFWFLTGASKQIRKTVLRTVYKEDLE